MERRAERLAGRKGGTQQAIGHFIGEVQPKQAGFHGGPRSFVLDLPPSNWSQFSPLPVKPVIFAEDSLKSELRIR
jgi:hypothetical protein